MKRPLGLLAVASIAALVLTACSGGESPNPTEPGGENKEPIRIGVVAPLSGAFASEGLELRRGYELAVQEAGAQIDGRPVELVFGDAQTPEDTIAEVNRLATRENVDLFVGTYATPSAQAGSEAADRYNLAWFDTHTVTPSLTERGLPNYVRISAIAPHFGGTSVEFIKDGLTGIITGKRVYVDSENGPYGTAVQAVQVNGLTAAGFEVQSATHAVAATDVTDSVLAAKAFNANVWLITGYVPDTSLLLRTAAANGFSPEAIVLVGAGDAKAVYEAVGADDLTGTFVIAYTSYVVQDSWAPGNAAFLDLFRRTYNSDPLGTVANTAFTGMTTVMKILDEAKGNTDVSVLVGTAKSLDIPLGGLPNGWGLDIDEQGQNQRVRLLAVQWRADGRTPAVWPAEAAGEEIQTRNN